MKCSPSVGCYATLVNLLFAKLTANWYISLELQNELKLEVEYIRKYNCNYEISQPRMLERLIWIIKYLDLP